MHKTFYKICWRVPTLMGLYSAWANIEQASYATKEEAYEAMKKLADELCKKLDTESVTKLDLYRHKLVEPTKHECKPPIIYRGVIVVENEVAFTSSPVGWLEVFEA